MSRRFLILPVPSTVALVASFIAGAAFADGQLVGWGDNSLAQVVRNPPTVVGYRDVAAGYSHSIGVKTDGSVVCWGANASGQSTVPARLVAVTRSPFATMARWSRGA